MKLEFFFENDDNRSSENFRNLMKHINDYLEKHPDLELNKIEHCDPDGHNVYALVSFKENEAKIKTLESLVQNLTAKVEEQIMKINDLECMLSHAKESLLSKDIVNDVNKDVVEAIRDACPEDHPAKKIVGEILQPTIDKILDEIDRGVVTKFAG